MNRILLIAMIITGTAFMVNAQPENFKEGGVIASPTTTFYIDFGTYFEDGIKAMGIWTKGYTWESIDSIAIAYVDSDYESPYDFSDDELNYEEMEIEDLMRLDANDHYIMLEIDDEIVEYLTNGGIEYIRINRHTYWFSKKDRKAMVKRAKEIYSL